jgi:ubiquinone/menaquinone biosynthesis C-methylase UbiE
MRFIDLINRRLPPAPWAEGEKIPWHEPDFSRRMLQEHLSQDHDMASRRFEIIDQQIEWIHSRLLSEKTAEILDLGCGPGLYASRLAKLGHRCSGIDCSPVSIAYAREKADRENLACRYVEGDVRETEYSTGYRLAMMIFGELNVFRKRDASTILGKAYEALEEEGHLLLEVLKPEAVRWIGEREPNWYSSKGGLFSDRPFLCLQENFRDADEKAATERYFIVDAATGEVSRYAASIQGYTEEEYGRALEECGFEGIEFHPAMRDDPTDETERDFLVISARRGLG